MGPVDRHCAIYTDTDSVTDGDDNSDPDPFTDSDTYSDGDSNTDAYTRILPGGGLRFHRLSMHDADVGAFQWQMQMTRLA